MVEQKLSKVLLVIVLLSLMGFLSHSANADPDTAARQYTLMKKRLKFEHLTTEHGLSQNTIYCILQDSKGFLWLGTESGLNRYDGYEIKIYEHESDNPGSLSSNTILALCEDRSGTLWVGTNNGLNKFVRPHEIFVHFKGYAETPGNLSNNYILSLCEGQNGFLWVGTKKGLNRYDKKNKTFTHFPHTSEDANDLPDNAECVKVILKDSGGVLWIGTPIGLYKFEPQRKKFELCPIDNGSKEKNDIRAICKDQNGMLWVGINNGGLFRFDPKRGEFIEYYKYNPKKNPNCLSHNSVYSIIEDPQSGNLWIGTKGDGLNQFNPKTKTFVHYIEDPWSPTSLSNDNIWSLYQDKAGLIWVGTEEGLNKLDKRKNEFRHWTEMPTEENSLNHKYIWAIFEDKSGIFWIGTNKGLNRFDRKTETFNSYEHDPNKEDSLSEGRVTAICEDSSGMLWVGTSKGVLNRFDRKAETSIHYPIIDDWINSIFEDHEGVLWIGTYEGLYKFDRDSDEFTLYRNESQKTPSLISSNVSCIIEDSDHNLWVGTEGDGLYRLNRDTGTFIRYTHKPKVSNSLSSDNVSYLYEDSSKTLWVGTYGGGLNKLQDREKGAFKAYTKKEKNGLPDDSVFGILEDKEGNLWISNYKGLSKFNPKTGEARNYDARDGLQSKEFNGRACHKSSDGEMFFGGTNGFNSFYPDRIEPNRNEPPIVITNFELLIEGPNKKGKIEEGKIVLSHKENVFTIEFSALDFSAPSKNMYKHKLEGVDKDWVEGDARKRSITYTNVSPGEHTFRVIGSNKDGTWNKEGETLKIKITPPFWQTWWFRIALGFLIIFAILAIHQMRTKYLRDKLAEQQRVQKILKQSRDEMERARDLAEIRHAENEKLLTAISVIFIAVDSDGMIFQWNKPAEKFFKIYRDDAVKKPFVEVLKGCISQDKLNKIIEKGLEQDKSASKEFEVSVDLKTKGKKGIRLLTSSISPIMDRTGRKLGFLLLAEDITHRKEEEMLRNLSKKLESLGQMASGIAHEIKTPLQYIGHNARFVSDSFHDAVNFYKTVIDSLPEIENSGKKEIAAKINQLVEEYDMEYITEEIPIASEQMIDGVNRVSDIIKAMTEFSHPGRGFKEKADINGLLKSTLVMVQNRIKKSADIQLELSKELPQIACFPAELNQVFLNLLVNALDAIVDTGNWGLIKISTTVERKEVVISISDTGCGIPEENSDDIFNPFFTTKEVGKGTGQGLSLAHNVIIEKHKGKLDFSSRVGEGTTFFIRLPIEGEH